MSNRITTLKALVDACQARGFVMTCYAEDPNDPDYAGSDGAKAQEALEACDEMYLRIHDPFLDERIGLAYIVNGLEPDEVIADYGGQRLSNLLNAETDLARATA